MKSEDTDAIDRLLDEALATYSNAEPRPGLAQRVCHRIQTTGARRRTFPGWAFAIPLAACLILTAIVWMRHAPKPNRQEPVRTAVRLPAPSNPPIQPAAPQRVTIRRTHRRREFPAPRPITGEERALLALVTNAPDLARDAFQDFVKRNSEPIRIESITIQPLQSDSWK